MQLDERKRKNAADIKAKIRHDRADAQQKKAADEENKMDNANQFSKKF